MLGSVFIVYSLLAITVTPTIDGIIHNELQAIKEYRKIQKYLQTVDHRKYTRDMMASLPPMLTQIWRDKSQFSGVHELVQAIDWQYAKFAANQTQTGIEPNTNAGVSTAPCDIQCQIQKRLTQLGVSGDCATDTGSFVYAFFETITNPKTAAQNSWSLNAVDSMAIFPQPGIQVGNFVFEGQRWECENITNSNPNFGMKYAFANMNVSSTSNAECPTSVTEIFRHSEGVMKFAVCIPKSCSNSDASKILDLVLQSKSCGVLTVESQVQHYSSGNIGLVVFLSMVGLLLVFATIYDYGVHQRMLDKLDADSIKEYITNPFFKFLLPFSVYTNGKMILNTRQKPGHIHCVHGIRFFSMMWVVSGHSYMQAFSAGISDEYLFLAWLPKHIYNLTITNCTFAVDSFFVMSGLMVSYLWFSEMHRNPWKVKSIPTWIMYYVHRYLRLTPVYAIVIVCYVYLLPLLSNGYIDEMPDAQYCRDGWWKNILYITNVFLPGKLCLGVSWYLTNDMQFHVFAPIVLVLLFFHPLVGIVIGLVLTGASLAVNLWTSWYYHFPTDLIYGLAPPDPIYINRSIEGGWFQAGEDPYLSLNYMAPWIRFVPYLIGVFLGFVMARNTSFKMNRLLSLGIWLVATGTALAIIYGLLYYSQGHQLPLGVRMLYNAVSRPLWACCLSWVIFACHYGYSGWINEFLSWKGFIPLSRLTYCSYLLHTVLVQILNSSWDRKQHFIGHFNWILCQTVPLLTLTFAVSFLFSCAFELPMLTLEKLLLSHRKEPSMAHDHVVLTQQLTNTNTVSPMENGDIPQV